jgi:hypothetical protein
MLRYVNDGVIAIKPEHQKNGNASIWSDESSFMQFPTSGIFMFGEHPQKPTIWNAWFQK